MTVFDQTVEVLGFDPGAPLEFSLELPEHLYPSTIDGFITYLEGDHGTPDDSEGSGERVPGEPEDSAAVGGGGEAPLD